MNVLGPSIAPVLLYDGACGFCARSVQLVLRYERRGTLRFASLTSRFAVEVRARHPVLDGVDSVVWFEPGQSGSPERVLVRSDAALAVARYLSGWWRLALVGYLLPRPIRDGLYRAIARHRHRWPAEAACIVPTAATNVRFLE